MARPFDSGRTRGIFAGSPALILIFLAALGIRTILFVSLAPWDAEVVEQRVLVEDARSYHDLATGIVETGAFGGFDDGFYLRTPGYPLFISGAFLVSGHRTWAVLLLQVVMDSLTVLAVFAISKELGLSRRVGLIASALYAVALIPATISVRLLSETLFTFLLALSIFLFVRGLRLESWKHLLFCGLVLGLAALVRPVAMCYSCILLAVILISGIRPGRKVLFAAALTLAFLAVIAPWQARNYRVFGRFALSNLAGTNFCRCNVAMTKALDEGLTLDEARARLEGTALAGVTDPFVRSDVYMRIAAGYISENPVTFVKYHLKGCAQIFATTARSGVLDIMNRPAAGSDITLMRDGLAAWAADRFRAAEREYFIGPVLAAGQLVVYAAAMLGLYLMMRGRLRLQAVLLMLTIAYFTLMPGAFSLCRFRIPAIPIYLITAACGMSFAWAAARRRHDSPCESVKHAGRR